MAAFYLWGLWSIPYKIENVKSELLIVDALTVIGITVRVSPPGGGWGKSPNFNLIFGNCFRDN